MPIPHVSQDLQHGSSVLVHTKYGPLRGGRTTNGAAVFLEVPYALPPVRFQDPHPLSEGYQYEDKHYVFETKHCYQPNDNGQQASVAPEIVKGFGDATENPLFLNIVAPSSFTSTSKLPVKVYIHGGFLQYGSPHELISQAQYVSQERSEVWVNVGYRLSVLGFLACDEPKVDGNFGFKDQWLALLWVRDNITAFGGDPDNIQLTGLSAGGHSVHQILHHISRLPVGQNSPIKSARLESNAILMIPKTPKELRPQFEALCHTLGLDPKAPNVLDILRDPHKVSPKTLMSVIETGAVGVYNATFRGCLDGSWMASDPDPMTWQRNGYFAKNLREKGVKSIVIGHLSEEWALYSISHPIDSPADIRSNLLRYFSRPIVDAMISLYPALPNTATSKELRRLFGDMLSDGQVHVPIRVLARDLTTARFPLLRYEIRWTPEQLRFSWYVTHGTDRSLWMVRIPSLNLPQKEKALEWLDAVDREVATLEQEGFQSRSIRQMLTLKEDQSIGWMEDEHWERLLSTADVLLGKRDIV